MAEDDKRKFDIPWATLLPIIAALAGIVVQFRPLVSERPVVPGEKAVEVVAEQDVDARLWQDPLVVAQKKKAELDTEALKRQVPLGRTQVHETDALACGLTSKCRPNRKASTRRFTANHPGSLASGFFQTPTSMKRPAKNGTATVS
jgi:hypothetical protein